MEVVANKQVILKPVLSEKSVNFYKDLKVCTFWVDPKATKKDIEHSFKELFGIDVKSVRTVVSRKQKTARSRKTYVAKTSRRYVKKAYIGIGENTLDIFESIK